MAHATLSPPSLLLSLALGLTAGLGPAGCGPAKDAGADEGAATGSTGAGGTADDGVSASGGMTLDTTAGMTDAGVTTDPNPTTGMSTDDGLDSTDDGGSFISMESDDGPPVPQGLGGMCDNGEQCESGFCYVLPMVGGACSECLTDSDCDSGTCALEFGLGYAVCTDGSAGSMCDSDEGCMGALICAELIDTGGVFPATFCSECDADLPCAGEQLCTPVYDTMGIGGSLACADAASVENGGGCPLVDGVGDGAVCASGFCGVADLFGALSLGICGECLVDADCPDKGQTCVDAMAGMNGLTPATCQ